MSFVEVLAVLAVSHLVGDFLLQTEWQASHKLGGLSRDAVARRALFTHVATYSLAFVPAAIWLAAEIELITLAVLATVVVSHLVQDDGRLVLAYIRRVKRAEPERHPGLALAVDQSVHVVWLFAAALIAAA